MVFLSYPESKLVVAHASTTTFHCHLDNPSISTVTQRLVETMSKTVFVTGATGLLGRQVLRAFDKAGWKAVGSGFSRAKPPTILKVDLEDQSAIQSALDETKYALL